MEKIHKEKEENKEKKTRRPEKQMMRVKMRVWKKLCVIGGMKDKGEVELLIKSNANES